MWLGRRGARVVDDDIFRRLVRTRDRIEDAYAEPLGLTTLARDAGLSPYHFLRLFQRVFGATPHAYLTSVRMARAKDLLARSASVTETCLRVGYLSLGSFSTRFSEQVGRSPGAWQHHVRRVVGVPARIGLIHIPCGYLRYCLPNRKIRETAVARVW
jgi:AraC-like DNA-binding protein